MPKKATTFTWPTRPIDQILGTKTFEAIQRFRSADGGIIKQGTFRSHGSTGNGLRLTESRILSADLLARLKAALLEPASYWIGHPRYRRLPPRPDFLFECRAAPFELAIAVDMKNPGWRMCCSSETYWGFHFASRLIRPIVKELFPEYASLSKTSMWKKGSLPKEVIGVATISESSRATSPPK